MYAKNIESKSDLKKMYPDFDDFCAYVSDDYEENKNKLREKKFGGKKLC